MDTNKLPQQARLLESAQVYDESDHEWVLAFRTDFKRQKTITPIEAITFNDSTTTYTSSSFDVRPYCNGLLLINLDVTGAPTDIVFYLEFSDDNANWYIYVIGAFGDLRYEDGAGDQMECLDFPILAPFLRLRAVATGTDAVKTFLITAKAVLNG